MLTRRRFLSSGVAIGGSLSARPLASALLIGYSHQVWDSPKTASGPITADGSLKAHAQKHGLLAGAAVDVRLLNSDEIYARVLSEQYSVLVAEGAMKWNALRPAPDKYSFADGDTLVAFAERNNIQVRGHNFVWHEALPDWFRSSVTKENARQYLVDHIMTVGTHYRGKMQSWDVVNEAVLPKDDRSDGLRKSPWMNLLGPDYIDIAFRTARQADPHALLAYNEYGLEYDNGEDEERRAFTLKLLRRMKAANVPLDAVGIQSHIKAGQPSTFGSGLRNFMASVREMGLQIYITELDVNEDDLPYDDVARRDDAIAELYRQYLSEVLAEPAVKAVLTWGVSDSHTWLNNGPTHRRKQPNRPQRSLPFDNDYRPTESFFAIRDSFDARTPVSI
jgi:endo-1,4-beta-xylanase